MHSAAVAATPANAAPDVLPSLNLSTNARARIRAVQDAGVALDESGLVVPNINRQILDKFSADFLNVRNIIQEQLRAGKHVLYLPGTYDLVHAGHASFIQESVDHYCAERNIGRDKLFVLVLADSDELISALKGAPSKNGSLPRPIESRDMFGHLCGDVSPRLIDLASLPFVDLVGTLPAPSDFGAVIRKTEFKAWLDVTRTKWNALLARGEAPADFADNFGKLLAHLDAENYGQVSASFRCVKSGVESLAKDKLTWRVQDWHFMLHQFLGDVGPGDADLNYRRVISKHDTYAGEVENIMSRCGIGATVVNDSVVVSTTQLISTFGWEALKERKIGQFVDLYRRGHIPFTEQA